MALPGPKNDKGFNQSHYDGLIAASEKYGFTPNAVENVVDPQARIDAMKNLATDNPLVIGVGGEYAEAGLTAAPQFPDVSFAVINGETDPSIPNLHAYFVRQGVPAYIAGVVAAQLSEAKKVGYLGGELIPPTTQSDDGFKAGVAAADPSIEYASTIVGNFNDPEKAKEAAAAQISAGADVIFALLDAGFPGVEQAVEESGKDVLLINPIFPRCDEGPNIVGVAFLSSGALGRSDHQRLHRTTHSPPSPRSTGSRTRTSRASSSATRSPSTRLWSTRRRRRSTAATSRSLKASSGRVILDAWRRDSGW